MSEEEQLAHAIVLSLQNDASSTPAVTDSKMEQDSTSDDSLVPLDSSLLDLFSDQLLEATLNTVCQIEDTVYRSCDLIIALCRRNGPQWRDNAITKIKNKVIFVILNIIIIDIIIGL